MLTAYSRGPLITHGSDGDYYLETLSSCHEAELASQIQEDTTATMILQNKSVEKLDYFTSMSEAEGLHWVILHGSPAEICGIISVEEGSFEHCDHNLAIWIKPTHRRNGVALEAICLALGLAKEQGVTEIESKIHITNEPTLQLMSKVSREFLTEKKSRMFDDYQEWVIKLSKDKDG